MEGDAMSRIALLILVLGLLVAFSPSGLAAGPNSEQARAIADIERLRGKVIYDYKAPGRLVEAVDFSGTKVTDAGLEHLKGLTTLQGLILAGTKVGDAGMEHLKGLTNLRWLVLSGTKVSDAGMKHL